MRRIVDECYAEAKRLLTENKDKLHLMANALMEHETLLPEQIDDVMAGAKPRHPKPPKADQGSQGGSAEAAIGGPAEEV